MPESDKESNQLYRRSLELLQEAELPFLLGGAYAYCVYTGVARHTKDFDLFVRPAHIDVALEVFRRAGYRAEKTFPHWLGKVLERDDTIDIIYRAGNGLCAVDDLWFERARQIEVFGIEARICPPEEMIWMKAYIMERERYDGADIAHLLFHCAAQLDWDHLLERFGPDWRVLLSHLILFGFIYPTEKDRIPPRVIAGLTSRLDEEEKRDPPLCRGTLLSRAQYLTDLREGGFCDARLESRSSMTPAEIDSWTHAIDDHVKPHAVAQED
jgi:hypothetical protein